MVKNALSDRIQILNYWYDRIGNKRYSRQLDKSIKDLISLLLEFPELGRKFKEREERFLLKKHFQIIYMINDNVIEILHVWDTRRNPDELKL